MACTGLCDTSPGNRIRRSRIYELCFQTAAAVIHISFKAVSAQLLNQTECFQPVVTHIGNKQVKPFGFWDGDPFAIHQHQDPFNPHSETDSRKVSTSRSEEVLRK